MLIGGGAIDAMRKAIENNKKLLGKRKHLREIYREYGSEEHHNYKKPIHHDSSPEQLNALRKKLRRKNRFYYSIQIGLLLTLIALVFGTIYYLIFN